MSAVLVNQHPRSIVQMQKPRALARVLIKKSGKVRVARLSGNGETFIKSRESADRCRHASAKGPHGVWIFNANQPFDLSPSSTGRRGTDFRFACLPISRSIPGT